RARNRRAASDTARDRGPNPPAQHTSTARPTAQPPVAYRQRVRHATVRTLECVLQQAGAFAPEVLRARRPGRAQIGDPRRARLEGPSIVIGRRGGTPEWDELLTRPEPVARKLHDVAPGPACLLFVGLHSGLQTFLAGRGDDVLLRRYYTPNWFQFVSIGKRKREPRQPSRFLPYRCRGR